LNSFGELTNGKSWKSLYFVQCTCSEYWNIRDRIVPVV